MGCQENSAASGMEAPAVGLSGPTVHHAVRLMAEQAAHLVDHVLPRVPLRQWVLTLPHRLRYLLAYNHALCRAVLGVAVRAVLGFYRRRAARTGVRDGRSGAVTVIQRFGGGLQLNVHFHTLLLDGVFAEGEDGSLEFHAAEPPSDEEVARLLATIYRLEPGGDDLGAVWGVILEHGLTESLRAVAEVNGESVRGSAANNSALVGAIWVVAAPAPLHELSFDVGVRHGISRAADEWGGTAGLTFAFPVWSAGHEGSTP